MNGENDVSGDKIKSRKIKETNSLRRIITAPSSSRAVALKKGRGARCSLSSEGDVLPFFGGWGNESEVSMTRLRHYQNLVERILVFLSEMALLSGHDIKRVGLGLTPRKISNFFGSLKYDGPRIEASSCAQHSV